MPVADDTKLGELLHAVAPEPPGDLLDLTTLHARARRRRRTRAATVGASVVALAGLAAAGLLHLAGSNPGQPSQVTSTPSPTPPAPTPPVNDVITTTDCRPHVSNGRLVATFTDDSSDRFDPPDPAITPKHTAAQVLAAYLASDRNKVVQVDPPPPDARPADTATPTPTASANSTRDTPPHSLTRQVFLATTSLAGGTRGQVWVVVTYHVAEPPSMGPAVGPATGTDEIEAFDAVTLHPLWDLYAMPISCG